METFWDKIVKILAVIGGGIAGLFGGWDWILTVLLGCMIADYLSGLAVAGMGKSLKSENGGLSSKVGVFGLLRKGLMLLVVLVAAMLDKAIGSDTSMFRDAVCWFYIANEGISLMENLNLAGVPFPKKLKELLEEKASEKVPEETPDDTDN
jgi:toxin secretion/phage lysis holin